MVECPAVLLLGVNGARLLRGHHIDELDDRSRLPVLLRLALENTLGLLLAALADRLRRWVRSLLALEPLSHLRDRVPDEGVVGLIPERNVLRSRLLREEFLAVFELGKSKV